MPMKRTISSRSPRPIRDAQWYPPRWPWRSVRVVRERSCSVPLCWGMTCAAASSSLWDRTWFGEAIAARRALVPPWAQRRRRRPSPSWTRQACATFCPTLLNRFRGFGAGYGTASTWKRLSTSPEWVLATESPPPPWCMKGSPEFGTFWKVSITYWTPCRLHRRPKR